ncbi:MAG: hypothetical protein KF805_12620 [Phycisphaeraceae bacterium]|nr:hypothetical protein [Phycisphaeraceae bacterium]
MIPNGLLSFVQYSLTLSIASSAGCFAGPGDFFLAMFAPFGFGGGEGVECGTKWCVSSGTVTSEANHRLPRLLDAGETLLFGIAWDFDEDFARIAVVLRVRTRK